MPALILSTLIFSLLAFTPAGAATGEHPGERLVRENNCAACHHIGNAPVSVPAPQVGPPWRRIGMRARPGWLMEYLTQPKELRPALAARMPNFRLSQAEAAALVAHLNQIKTPWPEPAADKTAKNDKNPAGFAALYPTLEKGDPARGKKLFLDMECAKCHGDSAMGTAPAGGKPGELGPDIREMSRKLTREGIASILFSPGATYPGTKMPNFFYDKGEALDENAGRQLADMTAYIASLERDKAPTDEAYRRAREQYPWAGAGAGQRIAWQFNCTGCHADTGVSGRDPIRLAPPLGYRNAPAFYTQNTLASWLMAPVSIGMHERMHQMGRMPTFGFSREEAAQIAEWLFTFDGPPGRRGGGMIMVENWRRQQRERQGP